MNISNIKYYFSNNGNFWHSIPFLKFLIPYCTGIVFSKYLSFNPTWISFYVIIGILIILSFLIRRLAYHIHQQAAMHGVLIFLFLFISGFQLSKIRDPLNKNVHIANHYESADYLYGKLTKTWKTPRTIRYLLELSAFKKEDNWHQGSGRIILTSTDTVQLNIGNNFIVKNRTKPIRKPTKEYLTDYSGYYKNQGVFLEQFIKNNDLVQHGFSDEKSIWIYGEQVNATFESILEENLDTLSFGILNALILGDKAHLRPETKSKFAEGGIMHILAVSGLHVGILFLILHTVFGYLKQLRFGKPAYYLIILSALWSYALIAGWSNSVVRATLMFTVFLVAEMINRKHYPLNTTAFSAFLILTIYPAAIFQISFQLSYAAVFAIILFYENFYKQISISNPTLDFLWKIACVSMAAQLGTFPITLYYFKIFQPGFLVFNLIAIPAAFLFLSGGIALITIGEVKVISGFISKLLDGLILLFDKMIGLLNSISPALQNIQISILQVGLLYLIIYTSCSFIYQKRLLNYVYLLLLLGFFFGIELHDVHKRKHQHGIEFLSKNQVVMYSGDTYFSYSFNHEENTETKMRDFIHFYNLKKEFKPQIHSSEKYDAIITGGKSILVVKSRAFKIPEHANFDYILSNLDLSPTESNYFKEKSTTYISYY